MSAYLEQKIKKLGLWVVIGAAYLLLGKLGLLLAIVQSNATAIWAPTGVAIAALIFFGYDVWPAIFVAAFLINATTAGTPLVVAFVIAAGNTLEGICAAYLVNKFSNGVRTFASARDVIRFFFFAGVIGPAVSATFGVTSLTLSGASTWGNYFPTWTTWWLGDLTGAIIITPLLLLWLTDHKIGWNVARIPEFIFIIVLVGAFSFLILADSIIFIYLLAPVFIWTAFRFRQREIPLAIFLLTEVSLWGTLHGYGPFIHYEAGSLNTSLLLLDAAMVSVAVTMLALAATVQEDKNIKKSLTEERTADRAALASVGDGLVVTNREADIVFMNSVAEAMLGLEPTEAIGKKYFDVIAMQRDDESFVPPDERPLSAALSGGKKIANSPLGSPEYYVRKNGTRFPVAYTKTPIVWDGTIIGASEVFRDVTKEIEVDKAKSEFISFASHQLRVPLSIVGLSSDLLRGEGKLFKPHSQEEMESYIRDIQEATAQMNDIINNLLNVSRIESQSLRPVFESVTIENLIAHNLKIMAPQIKKKEIAVTTRFPQHPTQCTTDPRLSQIIIQNLLSNAVKYTPEHGTIDIAVTQGGTYLTLVISDTGCGIPESEQKNIFKKLFRATNARKSGTDGSGLGLYIVKAMLDRLGGDISLASKENEGTTFVMRIPVNFEPSVDVDQREIS